MHSKVVSNATWIISCKIIQAIVGLIVSMLTARYLGPSRFGVISYAQSITAFFTPIMQIGLTNILVQEVINYPEEEGAIVGTATLMSFFSSIVCVIGVFLFSCIANKGENVTIIVCILYSVSLIAQSIELIQYWFQAKYLSKFTAVCSLVAYIVVGLYQIILLVTKQSIYFFAVTYTIQYGIIAVILLLLYKRLDGPHLQLSKSVAKRMFSSGRYYIVSGLMVTIFAQTDRVMINMILGDEATGYYSAAVTCAGLSSFVFQAIADSARPAIFESRKISKKDFELNICKLYAVVIYLSICQCLIMTIFSKLVIYILYGSNYYPAVAALRIVVWYTTFSYLGSVRNIWILAEKKQKYLWMINLSGASINIILNIFLIPMCGINGAAIASLLTQIFANIIISYIIRPIRYNNKLMVRGLNIKFILNMIINYKNNKI